MVIYVNKCSFATRDLGTQNNSVQNDIFLLNPNFIHSTGLQSSRNIFFFPWRFMLKLNSLATEEYETSACGIVHFRLHSTWENSFQTAYALVSFLSLWQNTRAKVKEERLNWSHGSRGLSSWSATWLPCHGPVTLWSKSA